MEKDERDEKDAFNQQTEFQAPIRWSKNSTIVQQNEKKERNVFEVSSFIGNL